MRRFLCSELVTLSWSGGEWTVNLEEIWESGAVLECEEPLLTGAQIQIRPANLLFAGRVAEVVKHEFGWRVEVQFSPLTPWSEEKFRPAHLLDLTQLG